MKRVASLLLLFTLLISGCIKHNPPSWETFVSEFIEGYYKLNPDKAVQVGRHEYDGLISDYSEKGIKEQITWLKKEREQINDFIDPILSETQKIEKKNLIRVIDENLFWLETMKWPGKNAGYYFYLLSPSTYTTRNYAPLEVRFKGYIRYLVSMKTAVAQIQESMSQNLPLPALYIDVAKNIFTGYAKHMRVDAPKVFQSINNDKMQQDFRSSTEEAITTILNFVSWLQLQEKNATNDISIGKNNFLRMIYVSDFVNVQLPELKSIIEKDLQDNTSDLKRACRQFAPNKTVEECINIIKSKKPEGDIVAAANNQLIALENFIKENKLVTIPKYSKITALPSPAYMRWLPAYGELPFPYEKNSEGRFYIAVPDTSLSEEEQIFNELSETDLILDAMQLVWPGEFLHSLFYNHSRSIAARVFYNNTTFKGWAHYASEMMLEQGYMKNSGELEISYLLKSILYDAGFLASIKIHTEGMKLPEAENLFIKLAYSDSASAKLHAQYAAGDPQYYSAAFGKILIKNLRDEWLSARQSKYTLKTFHDKFLSNGLIPIPMIRENMLRR